jgi:cell division protein FtsB
MVLGLTAVLMYFLMCRLRRARDQLQGKSDECSRVKDENSELDDEIKQLKESHQ